jgi:hypothetical protein
LKQVLVTLTLALLLPNVTATDDDQGQPQDPEQAAPPEPTGAAPEDCIHLGPLCIETPVCLGYGGGNGFIPVDLADRGIGIRIATSYDKGTNTWEDYYGGAVLCY